MTRTLIGLIAGFLLLFSIPAAHAGSRKAIPAKAYILLAEDESVLSQKNASEKLPPASTVKLMTAMVALDLLEPETKVIVSPFAAATRSSRPRLRIGDELTVEDLLHMALMKSVNSAAVALAEAAVGSEKDFVALMNRKAEEIGACDSHFENASGLPTEEPQYTTARDLIVILKKSLEYPLIKEIIGKKQTIVTTTAGKELYIGNTDALLWYRNDMVGGKTGFTNDARHCFVGAMDTDKGLVYAAVLGAPTRRRLWKSTQMLANMTADPEQTGPVVTVDEGPAPDPPGKHKAARHRKTKKKAAKLAT